MIILKFIIEDTFLENLQEVKLTLPPLILLGINLPQYFRKTNMKFHDKLTLFVHIIFLF